jgi:hypothetical protein
MPYKDFVYWSSQDEFEEVPGAGLDGGTYEGDFVTAFSPVDFIDDVKEAEVVVEPLEDIDME